MSLIKKKEFTKDEVMGYSTDNVIEYVIKRYNNIEKCNFLENWGYVLSYSSIRTIAMTINVKDNKKTEKENNEELKTFFGLLRFGDLFERRFVIENSHIIEEVNKLIRKNGYDFRDRVTLACGNYFDFLENHDLSEATIIDTVKIILNSEYASRQVLTMKNFAPYFDSILAKISDDKLLFILKDGKLSSKDQLRKVLLRMRFTSFPFDISTILNECKSKDKSYYETLVDLIFELKISISPRSYYYINMAKLNKNTRIKIIENMYSCHYSEYQNIIYFIEEKDLEYDELKLIVDKFCDRKDINILRRLLEVDKLSDFYNDILETITSIEDISYDDIRAIDLSGTNEDNRKRYVDIAINTIEDITELAEFAIKKQDWLSEVNIRDITEKVCESNNGYIIYSYTLLMDLLVIDYVSDLAKAIEKTDDINHIYLFLENISNIPNEIREEFIQKIISSRNIKYICLVAIFIDQTLIKKIFEIKAKMYKFIISSKLFDDEKLKEITTKLYAKPEKIDKLENLFNDNINRYSKKYKPDSKKKNVAYLISANLGYTSSYKNPDFEKKNADLKAVMEYEADRIESLRYKNSDNNDDGMNNKDKKYKMKKDKKDNK